MGRLAPHLKSCTAQKPLKPIKLEGNISPSAKQKKQVPLQLNVINILFLICKEVKPVHHTTKSAQKSDEYENLIPIKQGTWNEIAKMEIGARIIYVKSSL